MYHHSKWLMLQLTIKMIQSVLSTTCTQIIYTNLLKSQPYKNVCKGIDFTRHFIYKIIVYFMIKTNMKSVIKRSSVVCTCYCYWILNKFFANCIASINTISYYSKFIFYIIKQIRTENNSKKWIHKRSHLWIN